jgi:hypothetical protein
VPLQERSPEKLQQFFEAYGAPEAAAMCYLLATAENQSMVGGCSCCVLVLGLIGSSYLLHTPICMLFRPSEPLHLQP